MKQLSLSGEIQWLGAELSYNLSKLSTLPATESEGRTFQAVLIDWIVRAKGISID